MSLSLQIVLVVYGALVAGYCFEKKFESKRLIRILSKMLCSAGFLTVAVLCGLESGFQKEPLWSWGILSALVFSAVGDLLLALQKGEAGKKKFDRFTIGGMSFFWAHILFSAVFLRYQGFHWISAAASLALAGLQCWVLIRAKRPFDLFSVFSLIYLAALGFMAASGLWFFTRISPAEPSLYLVFTAVGAALFLVSDLLLCCKLFLNQKADWVNVGNTVTYFGGQLLFAMTIFYV